jgi:hypothetical protein
MIAKVASLMSRNASGGLKFRWVGGALLIATVAACGGTATVDVESRLPRSIGGVEIVYFRADSDEVARMAPDETPRKVASALGVPADRVTYLTGVRDIQGSYQSTIIQVRGVRAADLLEATIQTFRFVGARRIDTIAGKSVIRAATEDSDAVGDEMDLDVAPYFYGFDDVVVVIVGRPDYVEEAVRALP